MQFYFLSIVTNVLAGVILAGDYLAARFPGLQILLPSLNRRTARLTIGSITAAVGVLKLLVYANPLQIVVLGDLIPALAGIVLGGALAVAALRPEEEEGNDQDVGMEHPVHTTKEGSSRVVAADGPVEKTAQLALGYRVPVGLAGIAVALLHFLFPGAVLL
jgi:hypothetical protein